MEYETRNAVIEKTFLGVEEHGCFSFSLCLDYGNCSQVAGRWTLDGPVRDEHGKFMGRKGIGKGVDIIKRICELAGVESWEELKGKHIRAKCNHTSVVEIGHILKDEWLNFKHFFNEGEL